MIVSRLAVQEFMQQKLDDHRWIKTVSREHLQQAIQSLPLHGFAFKTKPWLHQLASFYVGACLPKFIFQLDMGLGKSKIIADLIAYHLGAGRIKNALVLVPNVINMTSWLEDLARHSDLQAVACTATGIQDKWKQLSEHQADVCVIDYQGLQLALTHKIKSGKGNKLVPDTEKLLCMGLRYQLCAYDEIHKLANAESSRYALLERLTAHMPYKYGATGTLFGDRPEDAWAQFKLVDNGATFGADKSLFYSAFFGTHVDNFAGRVFTFRSSMAWEFNQRMQHRSLRYKDSEVPEIDLPAKVQQVIKCYMTAEQTGHINRLRQQIKEAKKSGDTKRIQAPWLQLRQIASGYLNWTDAMGDHSVEFPSPKLDALEALVQGMAPEDKMVVCHYYTRTGAIIAEHLGKAGVGVVRLFGGTTDKPAARASFMNDPKCRVLVMNVDTGGVGNDGLQKVAKYLTFFESPTSPSLRKQVEKRLHRPGQTQRVFIYDLVMPGTVDQAILDAHAAGYDLFDALVNGDDIPGQKSLVD